ETERKDAEEHAAGDHGHDEVPGRQHGDEDRDDRGCGCGDSERTTGAEHHASLCFLAKRPCGLASMTTMARASTRSCALVPSSQTPATLWPPPMSTLPPTVPVTLPRPPVITTRNERTVW